MKASYFPGCTLKNKSKDLDEFKEDIINRPRFFDPNFIPPPPPEEF